MFAPDIISLRQFYASPLGRVSAGLIGQAIRRLWPEARGEAVLGIGFGAEYLEPYLPEASPVIVCMPAGQGAACWPQGGNNRVFLAHESELPLRENSINRVLVVHSAEHSEQLSGMMREIWNVLTPGGRALVIVPNRLSLWSRSSRSPLGYGRPFSMAQLRDLMEEQQFTITRSGSALFIPPLRLKLLWRMAPRIETVCRFLCLPFGGVLLIEAEKQVYASIRQPVQPKRYRMAGAVVAG